MAAASEVPISLHLCGNIRRNPILRNRVSSEFLCFTAFRNPFGNSLSHVLRIKTPMPRWDTKLLGSHPGQINLRSNSEQAPGYEIQDVSDSESNQGTDSASMHSSANNDTSPTETAGLGPEKRLPGRGCGKDVYEKSVEETLGLLKEQVEEDKKKWLAAKSEVADALPLSNMKPLKRSKVLAKQLISQSSARVIGFVSQIWVCARLFKVVAFEVRPSLLSGEIDGVLLDDVCQVGDVILVSDESVVECEMIIQDCETLVGYDLVTEDGNYLGKVRDYSFNLKDGNVTSLEFDALGFAVVPSSLVSTYWLDAEEVVEVLSDNIVVRQGSESRVRRLSKGFWQIGKSGATRRKMRSRRVKRTIPDGDQMFPESKRLPMMRRSVFLEEAELDGLNIRRERRPRRHEVQVEPE